MPDQNKGSICNYGHDDFIKPDTGALDRGALNTSYAVIANFYFPVTIKLPTEFPMLTYIYMYKPFNLTQAFAELAVHIPTSPTQLSTYIHTQRRYNTSTSIIGLIRIGHV